VTEIRFIEKTIHNKSARDKSVTDAYGKEHIIYPEQVKTLVIIQNKLKDLCEKDSK